MGAALLVLRQLMWWASLRAQRYTARYRSALALWNSRFAIPQGKVWWQSRHVCCVSAFGGHIARSVMFFLQGMPPNPKKAVPICAVSFEFVQIMVA